MTINCDVPKIGSGFCRSVQNGGCGGGKFYGGFCPGNSDIRCCVIPGPQIPAPPPPNPCTPSGVDKLLFEDDIATFNAAKSAQNPSCFDWSDDGSSCSPDDLGEFDFLASLPATRFRISEHQGARTLQRHHKGTHRFQLGKGFVRRVQSVQRLREFQGARVSSHRGCLCLFGPSGFRGEEDDEEREGDRECDDFAETEVCSEEFGKKETPHSYIFGVFGVRLKSTFPVLEFLNLLQLAGALTKPVPFACSSSLAQVHLLKCKYSRELGRTKFKTGSLPSWLRSRDLR